MIRELRISFGKNDIKRYVLTVTESDKINSIIALEYNAENISQDVCYTTILIFSRENIRTPQSEDIDTDTHLNNFSDLLQNSWKQGEPVEFSDWFSSFETLTWDFKNTKDFPVEGNIKSLHLIEKQNAQILLQLKSLETLNEIITKINSDDLQSLIDSAYNKNIDFRINNLLNELKSIQATNENLYKPHISFLKNKLRTYKEIIKSKRLEAEKENLPIISDLIDKAVVEAKESENFKDAWSFLLSVQEKFKELALDKESHDALWVVLQDSFNTLKGRQKSFFAELHEKRKENYERLQPRVLECISLANESDNFRSVWQKLLAVQKEFKGIKMEKTQHESLWQQLQNAFETIKKREELYNNEMQDEWNANFTSLNEEISNCSNMIDSSTDLKSTWKHCIETQEKFKNISLQREQHEELWQKMQEVFEKLKDVQEKENENYGKNCNENFSRLDKIADVSIREAEMNKNFKNTFEKLKERQKQIFEARPLKPQQKNHLIEKINFAFSIIRQRQDKYFDEKREQWRKKQIDFLEKMKSKKERLAEVFEKIEGSIAHSEHYLKQIQEERETVAGEDEQKVSFLSNKIEEVKEQLSDKENSLKELQEKIKNVTSTIDGVNKNLEEDEEKYQKRQEKLLKE